MTDGGYEVSWPILILLLCVAVQRLGELVLGRVNTRALLEQGAIEYGPRHYPLFILLHSSWLVSLFVWALVSEPSLNWPLCGLYVVLQGGRVWVLLTLGRFWTTRIISLPDAPLILSGPYKYVRHPNYWIVACEVALLPSVIGAWEVAVVYTVLNAALLAHRIKIENAALLSRR